MLLLTRCILIGGLVLFQPAFFALAQNQFCAVLGLRNAPQFEDLDSLSALTSGDFNGDGRPDLALALNDTARQMFAVLIRLNNGAGGFQAPLSFTVEANPLAISAGDFNGDGKVDLVVAHRASGEFLRFYQGHGQGSFAAGAQLALAQPQDIAAITSVDLTGDGRPELIVQSDNYHDDNQVITPFVNVLRNNGSGTFIVAVRIDGKGAVVADFNSDNRPDLVLTRGNALRVLAGRGDATFGPELNQSVTLREWQHSLTTGDFNGDGKVDVAATTGPTASFTDGQVVILPGNGAGDFTGRLTFTDLRGIISLVRAVRVAGRTDLVVADETAMSYLPNNGGAQFRRADTVLAPGLRDVVVADFNGDGREDVATLSRTVTLLINNGNGGFTDAPFITEPRNTFLKIALGDLTGDSRDDLAALEAPNQLTVLRGDGAGRFARAQAFTLGENPTDVLIADFNRDGRRDVAALSRNGLSVYSGNSAGELNAATNFNVGNEPLNFTVLDYDADGRVDLAVTLNNQSSVALLRNNGSGFEAPRNVSRPANNAEIISADFNGDGRGDLFVTGNNDRGYALTSNGDGGFTERGSYDIGSGARKLALGDFNGDGRADVAVGSAAASSAASDIVVLISNSNGTFTPTLRVEWGNNHAPLAVTDLNSDGRSDLVLSNVRESLVLLTGDGAGRFPFTFDRDGLAFPRSYFLLNSAPNDLVSKDLNGDGAPDFVLAGRGLTVLYGTCFRAANALAAVSAASYTAPLAPESIGAAFGARLATGTARAATDPLPVNLAGTTATLFDSANVLHPVPLFFVSPAQVNFLTPRTAAPGNAELRITGGDGAYSVGNVTLANTAPGLFTANGNSLGVAAGVALRVRTNGAQVFEPIMQFNGSSFAPLPIDLGPESDQVFLVLFGTGLRYRGATPVTAAMGGTNAEVLYAGTQGSFIGVDQINLRLSRSLIGRGVLNVTVAVGTQAANTVQIQIK